MEYIEVKFNLHSSLETKKKDIPIGIIKGYLATFDIDRGRDRFLQGAFQASIMRHREAGRPIRMKAYHETIIGGFPIDNVFEDDKGLWVEGEINLETQLGREIYSLIRQGVLSDMSIGYTQKESDIENGIRVIKVAEIWEGSVVDEPMNPMAKITEVKKVNSRESLPKTFADKNRMWEASAAEKRVREWANAEIPNDKYKKAFLWWDGEGDKFSDYKLQICDILDRELKVVPRAVFAVRAVLSGARGGVDIPEEDKTKIKKVVNLLYREMELDEPFGKGEAKAFSITELKNMQRSILCDVLKHCEISLKAAEEFANVLMTTEIVVDSEEQNAIKRISEAVKNFETTIKGE